MKEGCRRVRVRERIEDATLLALKMEEGARSQGMQATTRSWESLGTDSPFASPEGMQPC